MTHAETMLHFDLEMRNEISWRILRGWAVDVDYTVCIVVPPPATSDRYAKISEQVKEAAQRLLPRSWSYTVRADSARGEVRVDIVQ